MLTKKIIAILCFIGLLFIGFFYTFFKHPLPEDLLENNRLRYVEKNSFKLESAESYKTFKRNYVFNKKMPGDNEDSEEEIIWKFPKKSTKKPQRTNKIATHKHEKTNSLQSLKKKQESLWKDWVKNNNFVSIGEYYTSCDAIKRVMIGQVLMVEDEELGGVKSQSVVNVTWDHEILDGKLYIDVSYNGNNLYNNKFDLCTANEKVIQCPLLAQLSYYVVDIKIPNFIPKGRYTTKAWAEDQEGQIIGCGFSDFTI